LKTGHPGSSEAVAILERLRFAPEILAEVRTALGEEELSFQDLVARLERSETEAAARAAELTALTREYQAKVEQVEQARHRYETSEARLRGEAYEEAARVLREARREASLIIGELRRQTETAAAEEARARLLAAEKKAAAEAERLAREIAPAAAPGGEPLAEGATVTVRGTGTRGEIAEIDGAKGRARVRFGGVEAWVDVADLVPAPGRRPSGTVKVSLEGDLSPRLHLLGATVEEAVGELARYLDRAVAAQLPSVEIIHGHGTGRLREGIRQYLRTHAAVDSYGPGAGGNEGVTIVRFRNQ
jgi:DNA mismatch repair protein MutS2